MLSRKQEIREYENLLKNNEATIARLNGENKHIKSHIKFLRGLAVEEGELPENPPIQRWQEENTNELDS